MVSGLDTHRRNVKDFERYVVFATQSRAAEQFLVSGRFPEGLGIQYDPSMRRESEGGGALFSYIKRSRSHCMRANFVPPIH